MPDRKYEDSINEETKYINRDAEISANQKEAEKYEKVSAIIEKMASEHPGISPETITMLKGYYQGDSRSISAIIEELGAYAAGLPPVEPTIFGKNSEDIQNILNSTAENQIPHESIHVTSPEPTTPTQTVDVELSDMFVPNTPSSAYQGLETTTETPKQFVKTTNESNEGGYSDTATVVMLTTSGFFSIITMILAIAVLL